MIANDSNSRLHVKSYFAASIADAMDAARVELGPEALLLNSREAPPEARHLGAFEVVFGLRSTPAPLAEAAPTPVNQADELHRFMGEIRDLVTKVRSDQERDPGRGFIEQSLFDAGVTRSLAREIEAAVHQRCHTRGVVRFSQPKTCFGQISAELVRETVQELERRFEVLPQIGRVTALIGPPGAGKTSTLVKLAITNGLLEQRPVRLVSIDHHRIAAADQLRTYAGILGVPFTLAETTLGIEDAIQSAPPQTLVLIDTPGITAASLDMAQDLASFLFGRQEIDTQLVLTAGTRPSDLARIVDLFQVFRPRKLLFTRLDETDSTASIFCEASRTGLPLSFFSTGQVIPEEIEPAAKERVTASLVRELPQALEAVA
jgi:flagellar biosynthesis protein FlhF